MKGSPLLIRRGTGQGYRFSFLNYVHEVPKRGLMLAFAPTRRRLINGFLSRLFARAGYSAIGFRLMLSQIRKLPQVAECIRTHRLHVIHLTRQNVLKTHISRLVSKTTRQPHPEIRIKVPRIHVPPATLIRKLDRIDWDNRMAESMFSSLPRKSVAYEELCRNEVAVCRGLLSFLGIDQHQDLSSSLVKINPDKMEQVVENYDEVRACLAKTIYAWCQTAELMGTCGTLSMAHESSVLPPVRAPVREQVVGPAKLYVGVYK